MSDTLVTLDEFVKMIVGKSSCSAFKVRISNGKVLQRFLDAEHPSYDTYRLEMPVDEFLDKFPCVADALGFTYTTVARGETGTGRPYFDCRVAATPLDKWILERAE